MSEGYWDRDRDQGQGVCLLGTMPIERWQSVLFVNANKNPNLFY